jgi:hypothetical protein
MSTTITIQGVEESVARRLEAEARRRGLSTEEFALELIRRALGAGRGQTYHDLDSLAGTWSEEQADEFLAAVADFEKVDETLWR